MPTSVSEKNQLDRAYIITGPTSGYGLATAQEVAKHGTVVLVGRDREKLRALQREIQQKGGDAGRSFATFRMLRALSARPPR
jgi:short-subunit dehydrogenase